MKTNDRAIWEIIKDIFTYINYIFLSRERRLSSNISLVKEKYWFRKLSERNLNIYLVIEEDKELKDYLSSRKKVRKLLRDKNERQNFKKWLETKTII
ncbi:hypothetical protein CSV77_13835 [Sporosarcina sp. P16b]|uniref:hypothetical protein n=1 Tax=Sporosarcina sp. P16b TaxID=2048261 RepID=UPI000C16D168|nr:hypothetical protein [Sporosarcina sp. P16b]PIC69368.1 hypothetical protein CSV77_13835 [Sporosarcina sp. P16b]